MLEAGASAVMLLVIMLGGGLVLWLGVPFGWLYAGSQIQAKTDSVGTAILAMLVGSIVSVIVIAMALAWLNQKHVELQESRGIEGRGNTALEITMTVSAVVAIAVFAFWFLILEGPGPSLAPQN